MHAFLQQAAQRRSQRQRGERERERKKFACGTYRCLHGLSSSMGILRGPYGCLWGTKCFGCEAFARKTEAEAGLVSPIRSDDSAPGRGWSEARTGVKRDPEGTSPPRQAVLRAGTACTAARLAAGGVDGGGKESPAERQQAPASGSCNSPESGWADSRSVSIPRTVGTSGPHSWS